MSSPVSRSLRAVESERTQGSVPVAVAAALLMIWIGWFVFARVPLYETSAIARIEASAAAHPVDARMSGRAIIVNLSVGAAVHAGDVLVELEAEAERLALDEARTRQAALEPEVASVRREIVAEERAIEDERRGSAVARDEQRAILRETEAALRLADDDARRLSRLRARGLISEQDDTRGRAEVEQRRASSEAATADHPDVAMTLNNLALPARQHGARPCGRAAL
jgi:multidrug resistance efflux pump